LIDTIQSGSPNPFTRPCDDAAPIRHYDLACRFKTVTWLCPSGCRAPHVKSSDRLRHLADRCRNSWIDTSDGSRAYGALGGRRLKTLRGLTPYAFISKCWTTEPERFTLNPHPQKPGPNT